MATSPEYLRVREAHCRKMAEKATEPGIKRIHEDLAERYAHEADDVGNKTAADLAGADRRQSVLASS